MTNQKLEKVKSEIEKTKSKISEFQVKLRLLERQKTDLENEQIVALVRSEKISDAQLSALLESLCKAGPDAVPAEVRIFDKQKRLEETHNANLNES